MLGQEVVGHRTLLFKLNMHLYAQRGDTVQRIFWMNRSLGPIREMSLGRISLIGNMQGPQSLARLHSTIPGLVKDARLQINASRSRGKTEKEIVLKEILNMPVEALAPYIPSRITRSLPGLEREAMRIEKLRSVQKVQLIDGSMLDVHDGRRERVTPTKQLKVVQKLENHMSIERSRTRERLYNEILRIVAEESTDPYLRLPVWRITRLEHSVDYRFCTVRWVIDDADDFKRYFEPLRTALNQSNSFIRHILATRNSLKVTPYIKFVYENYSSSHASGLDSS